MSLLAIPLMAQRVLHAGAAQVGLLTMLGTVAFVVIGLPAGAWVDRRRRRGIMILADLVRACLLASVPIAWVLGALTLLHLYAVVLLTGVATVFFDVAHLSFVPFVSGPERLVAANSALVGLSSAAEISGRGVGGLIIQALGAPLAVVVDAVSYLWSALFLGHLGRAEPEPSGAHRDPIWREVIQGLRLVLTHPVLRPILLEGALTNLCIQMCEVAFLVMFATELRLPAGALGLFLAVGGVGSLLGSLCAPAAGRWLGQGRALWLPSMATAPFAVAIGFVDRGPALWIAAAGWLVICAKVGMDNVLKVAFRQRATPDRLLGRMNATFRFLFMGALTLGAALGGLIGQYAGLRAALWTAITGLCLRWIILYLSPLRNLDSP